MKFTVNTKEMEKALTDIQVKGKYQKDTGLTNGSLDSTVKFNCVGNRLTLSNADVGTFVVKLFLEVEGEEDGSYVGDVTKIISYLKKFGETTNFTVGDSLTITSGSRKAKMPTIVEHPHDNAISRIDNMTNHISYREDEQMFSFGKGKFECKFAMSSEDFDSTMAMAELVGRGIYRIETKDGDVKFSSTQHATNHYEEVIETSQYVGEEATVEFSSPLHKFFPKGQVLNFYVRDDFPILVISEDRMIIKAPTIEG